jgi:hypothetical protein
MDEAEARVLLSQQIEVLRALPFAELRDRFLDSEEHLDVAGDSGSLYQVEVQALRDDPRVQDGNLRVIVSIDDGGWRAFSPLNDGFIVAPDGKFVGE